MSAVAYPAATPLDAPTQAGRSAILATAGGLAQLPVFLPNTVLSGVGSNPIFGNVIGVGGATATAILDGFDAAVELVAAPLGVGLIRYPSSLPAAPLTANQGGRAFVQPTVRCGARMRRSAVGGNAGAASGLLMSWDQNLLNALPGAGDIKNGCYGIVGDGAGGWRFVAMDAGAFLTNQPLTLPGLTTDYNDFELVHTPGGLNGPGQVEVWINGVQAFAYIIGTAALPPVLVAAGNFGLNMALWHYSTGAVLPNLRIAQVWTISQAGV